MKTEPELNLYACYFVLITHSMTEPFFDQTGEGIVHTKMWSQKFKDLRDYALRLPKFGTDTANKEVCKKPFIIQIDLVPLYPPSLPPFSDQRPG